MDFHGVVFYMAVWNVLQPIVVEDLSMVEMMDILESCISVKIKEMVHGE